MRGQANFEAEEYLKNKSDILAIKAKKAGGINNIVVPDSLIVRIEGDDWYGYKITEHMCRRAPHLIMEEVGRQLSDETINIDDTSILADYVSRKTKMMVFKARNTGSESGQISASIVQSDVNGWYGINVAPEVCANIATQINTNYSKAREEDKLEANKGVEHLGL